MQKDHPLKYSSAGVVTIIFLSFIVAVLKIQDPVAQTFAAIGINMALLFVILNMGALVYGIITRNRGDPD